jgi:long-chain acyl-CoA synthetase
MDQFDLANGFSHPTVPLWQRPWLDAYPRDVPSSLPYPNMPVSALLEDTARRFPNRLGCTIYGKPITFTRLAEQAHRLAHSLAGLGSGPGRRVGVLLPNIPEYIIALQAIWLTGATALQLSPLMVAEEVNKWLEATDCRIVVTLDLLTPMVTGALETGLLEHLVVASLAERMAPWRGWLYRVERIRRRGGVRLRSNENVHLFHHLLKTTPYHQTPRLVPEEDVAVVMPTGGTTGSPKAVMLTHRNLVANATQLRAWSRGEDGTEGVLAVLPFFHVYGLTVCMLTSIAKAATIHMHPRFETVAVLDMIEKYHIELVLAVPAMLAAMNRELRKKPRELSFVRGVMTGASAIDKNVRAEFESYCPARVVEGYGLSEASPVTHVNPMDEHNRPGSIGLPLPDTDARIMDQTTGMEELPTGSVGELVIRGPQVMKGYFNNPAETQRALRNGWLFTGDLAKRDRDGFFSIVDRKKDIIKTSGFLVFPAEVEEVLNRCEGVAETAVIGVPDAERGEIIKAMVVANPGATLELTTLEQHCIAHLGKQKRPRQIEIVSELPKNFLGKIQRRRLREGPPGSNGDKVTR